MRFVSRAQLALAVFMATGAAAAPRTLQYVRNPGAERCPDAAALTRAVNAELGRTVYGSAGDTAGERQEVAIEAAPPGLQARVVHRDSSGRASPARVLRSAATDCRELAAALKLLLVVSADEDAPAPPRRVLTPTVPVAAAPAFPWFGALSLELGAVAGLAPGFAPLAAVEARLGRERWSIGLGVQASPRLRQGGVESELVGLGLTPCFHSGGFGACALLNGSAVTFSEGGARATAFPLGLGARAQFDWPAASRWRLRVHVDAWAQLRRAQVELGDGNVWTAPLLAGTVGVGGVLGATDLFGSAQ